MTVVSSKEFLTHGDRYLDLALNERVFIQKGNYTFFVVNADRDDEENDVEMLEMLKERRNDEMVSVGKFRNFLKCKVRKNRITG